MCSASACHAPWLVLVNSVADFAGGQQKEACPQWTKSRHLCPRHPPIESRNHATVNWRFRRSQSAGRNLSRRCGSVTVGFIDLARSFYLIGRLPVEVGPWSKFETHNQDGEPAAPLCIQEISDGFETNLRPTALARH